MWVKFGSAKRNFSQDRLRSLNESKDVGMNALELMHSSPEEEYTKRFAAMLIPKLNKTERRGSQHFMSAGEGGGWHEFQCLLRYEYYTL